MDRNSRRIGSFLDLAKRDGKRLITFKGSILNLKRIAAMLLIMSTPVVPLQYAVAAEDLIPMTLHLPGEAAPKLSIRPTVSMTPSTCVNYSGSQKIVTHVGLHSHANGAHRKVNPEDYLIVVLKKDADKEDFNSKIKDLDGELVRTIKLGNFAELMVVASERGKVAATQKELSADKDVAIVEKNRTIRVLQAQAPPNDLLFNQMLDMSDMNYAAARSIGGYVNSPASIFLIDTGVQAIGWGELASANAIQFDFSNPTRPTGALEKLHDVVFHGTATATPFCGSNNILGYAGAGNFEGNRCTLIECRITGPSGFSSSLSIYDAIAFIYSNVALGRFATGPVNLSFGTTSGSSLNADPIIQMLAQGLQNIGSLLVLAAGNEGVMDSSPELYARRIAAIDPSTNLLAGFSNFGPFNRAAPGVNVPCYVPYSYALPYFESGTSFAAPRWCAAILDVMAALPMGVRSAYLADQIVENTATVTSEGYHIPNLYAALLAASKY